jgi:RNA polymerase sigma-70 factor, ECF subfamily
VGDIVPESADIHEQFLKTHMPHQRQVMAYLIGKLRNFHVAEDLWQEVTVAAWKSYDTYKPDKPYPAWLFGIARNLMLKYLRDKGDEQSLSPEIIEQVADTMVEDDDQLVEEREALRHCVELLAPSQRELLQMRYEQDVSLKDLATMFGKTVGAVNMLLSRIRQSLLQCAGKVRTTETTQ